MNAEEKAKIPKLRGLYDITTYQMWKITAPYATEKYIFAGSEKDAKERAAEIFKDYQYKPAVKEILSPYAGGI